MSKSIWFILVIAFTFPAIAFGQARRQPARGPATTAPEESREEIGPPTSSSNAPAGRRPTVAHVDIVDATGARIKNAKTSLKTRPNREYDPLLVESDVRTLLQSGYYYSAIPRMVETRDGMYVKFEVREKPLIREIILIGNRAFSDKVLIKDLGFKVNDAIDPFTVNEGKRRLEERYHTRGFPKTTVTITEGVNTKDRRVVYHINEGPLERIGSVDFVGNDPNLATGGRLKSLVQSKPGWFYYFGGKVDMQKIEEDREKLVLYYRSLGYFEAKVETMFDYDDGNKWMRLTFVINEGMRFVVRKITIQGNEKFSEEELREKFFLQEGQYFNQGKMEADTQGMLDRYGEIGYQFADIHPNPTFSEEPGELSLVYHIKEGKPHHIEEIRIEIAGENPRTRDSVVLNRLMIRPGEILNKRKLNVGIARIKGSTIFNTDPTMGSIPEATVIPPDIQDLERYTRRAEDDAQPPGEAYTRDSAPRN